jgi:hypothetical protein
MQPEERAAHRSSSSQQQRKKPFNSVAQDVEQWKVCRDEKHGFVLRYPPDWHSTTPEGTCIQIQKGTSREPEGLPEGDVFVRMFSVPFSFPSFQRDKAFFPQELDNISQGIEYRDRQELAIANLPAIRANFRTSGPTPNWGVEYAIRKGDRILDIYVSQPAPDVLKEFEAIVRTLRW